MPLRLPSVVGVIRVRLRNRLASALPTLRFYNCWNELEAALQHRGELVAFVDPLAEESIVARGAEALATHRNLAIVVYTALEPEAIRQAVPLVMAGVVDFLFHGIEDSPERVQRLLERIETRRPLDKLWSEVSTRIARLPIPLREAIEAMFSDPGGFHTTADLARRAGLSSRAVHRWMAVAGIGSARQLVAAARISMAYRLLAHHELSVEQVAMRLNYSSSDQLSTHFAELTQHTATALRRTVTDEGFCDLVIRSLTRVAPERRLRALTPSAP